MEKHKVQPSSRSSSSKTRIDPATHRNETVSESGKGGVGTPITPMKLKTKRRF